MSSVTIVTAATVVLEKIGVRAWFLQMLTIFYFTNYLFVKISVNQIDSNEEQIYTFFQENWS